MIGIKRIFGIFSATLIVCLLFSSTVFAHPYDYTKSCPVCRNTCFVHTETSGPSSTYCYITVTREFCSQCAYRKEYSSQKNHSFFKNYTYGQYASSSPDYYKLHYKFVCDRCNCGYYKNSTYLGSEAHSWYGSECTKCFLRK
ncbi:MAG: hypothetical protein N2645_09205 [Clostridia bacterium]|nr:hypothetical protein [Clostridia bacterium]